MDDIGLGIQRKVGFNDDCMRENMVDLYLKFLRYFYLLMEVHRMFKLASLGLQDYIVKYLKAILSFKWNETLKSKVF